MRKPGVLRGTRNMVVPCLSGAFGSVRASMKKSLPTGALAMNAFSPLRIHSSPCRSARRRRPALGSSAGGRRLSEPAPGSVMPLPSTKVSSAMKSGRKRCFWSSVHAAEIRWLHFQFWLNAFEIALSARAISAITSACETKSAPWPPHSFGTASVRKPSFDPFLMMSQSQVSAAVGIASRSSEIGRTSSSANLRAAICQERCSLLRVKSMCVPSGSLGRDRGGGAAIAGDMLGDAQARLAVAVARMLADAGIVQVLLQRHVAHHAHRTEDFCRVLGGLDDDVRDEHLRDGGERQVGDAGVRPGVGMIARP